MINRKYYLDAGRGIAILFVITAHVSGNITDLDKITSYIHGYGATGVQIFFFISGISLCLSFDNRKEKISFFYLRRFLRVYPLYWFGIFIYTFLFNDINIFPDFTNKEVITNFLLIHNLIGNLGIVPGGWTISTEIIFYLFFPLIYLWMKKHKIIFFISFILTVVLVYYILNILVWKFELINVSFLRIYHWTFIQWIVFAIGMFFFIKKIELKNFKLIFLLMSSFFIISLVAFEEIYRFKLLIFYPTKLILISLFTIFLILFLKILIKNNNFLTFIGRYSYSLYITHSLGIFITRNLLNKLNYDYNGIFGFITFFSFTLIISIFFSVFTYNLVEKNGIRLGNFIIKKLNE